MPAARARSTEDVISSSEGWYPTGSIGYQHAPRQKIGTPLTDSWKPPSARSDSIVRNPTSPRSSTVPSTTTDTGYSGWSPWVWGHQRSTSSSWISPDTTTAPSSTDTSSGAARPATRTSAAGGPPSGPICAPVTSTVTATAPGPVPGPAGCTGHVASDPARHDLDRARRPGARPDATAPPAPGSPPTRPGGRAAWSGTTAGSGSTRPGPSTGDGGVAAPGPGSSAAKRMHSSLLASRASTGRRWEANIDSEWRRWRAVEPHVGQRRQPLETQDPPVRRRGRRARRTAPGTTSPGRRAGPAGRRRPHGLQRGRRRARDLGGHPAQALALQVLGTRPGAGRRGRTGPRRAGQQVVGLGQPPYRDSSTRMASSQCSGHLAEHAVEVDVAPAHDPGHGELEALGPLGHLPERLGRRLGARRVVAVQPVDEGGGQLGAGAALTAQAERVEVEGLEVLGGQPGQVVAQARRHADHGIVRRSPGEVVPGRGPRPARPGRDRPAGPGRGGCARRRAAGRPGRRGRRAGTGRRSRRPPARSSRRCGSSRATGRPGRWRPGRWWSSRGRCRRTRRRCRGGTRRPPRRCTAAPCASCSSTWSTTGTPDVHLGDVDAVQRPQVLGRVLEERPLVALEVAAERERRRRPPGPGRGRAAPRSTRRRSSWSPSSCARTACRGWGTKVSAVNVRGPTVIPAPRPGTAGPRATARPGRRRASRPGRCRGGRAGRG